MTLTPLQQAELERDAAFERIEELEARVRELEASLAAAESECHRKNCVTLDADREHAETRCAVYREALEALFREREQIGEYDQTEAEYHAGEALAFPDAAADRLLARLRAAERVITFCGAAPNVGCELEHIEAMDAWRRAREEQKP